MKLEDAEKIVKTAEENDMELELRPDYSGRGMFGKTTAGVVGSKVEIVEAATLAGLKPREFKWDNMARDMIAY